MKASRHTVTLSLLALSLLEPTFFAAKVLAQNSGNPPLNTAITPSTPARKTSSSAYALGVQLYTAKRYKEASQAFWKAITTEGGEAPAWLYMAHSCLGAGDRASALKYYQSVYKLYPNREEGLVAKQYITRLAGRTPLPIEENGEDEKAALPSKNTNLENITVVRPVVGHPEVDPNLVKEIQASIKKIPTPIKAYLERAEIKIVLTPTMIDKYPEGAYQEVAGYEGGTKKSCAGLFHPRSREVVLAQHYVDEGTDLVGHAIPSNSVKQTFLHECGHALDFSVGRISMTDDYRFNYYKDIANIPDDVATKIRYYLQKSTRGQRESCGELMGILMGNERANTSLMKQYFPNCIAFLKKKLGLF